VNLGTIVLLLLLVGFIYLAVTGRLSSIATAVGTLKK